ncbi:MAG: hypothetical protein N3F09_00650 [Bacteroidia bacterium]|nr:hypothetical protein [Bacteroidia bacterium]
MKDSLLTDSFFIWPGSIKLTTLKHEPLPDSAFYFNAKTNKIHILQKSTDTLLLSYRAYPILFKKKFQTLDSAGILGKAKSLNELSPYFKGPVMRPGESGFFQNSDGLQKNGSISRGISIGNNQNSSLQSQLNLQVFGKLTEDIEIEMAATDNSIPFQPDGTTTQLQEFDRVYITAKTPFVKLTAGDFQSRQNERNHFLKYFKRLQGLQSENLYSDSAGKWNLYSKLSFAVSKGKFSRMVFYGQEGNQGPYRLRGAANELFIIVLSGTERIYVDGQLMERGQDKDYIIDYNTAELRFTARMPITKDKRIVAEFQYAERNYARSLLEWNEEMNFKKTVVFMNFIREQDNPNRTLQQNLTPEQKKLLFQIGDSLWKAVTPSAFKTEFNPDEILYVKKDTLHQNVLYQDIFVFKTTPQPNDTFYKVTFSPVGAGRGNYVRDASSANGRVFKWVAPVNGIPSGDHEPVVLLVTPKRQSLFNAGLSHSITPRQVIEVQGAISENNLNRFSPYQKSDNAGFAGMGQWSGFFPFRKNSNHGWATQVKTELLSRHFVPFERFRSVEFDRDWNRPLDGRIRQQQSYMLAKTGYKSPKADISGQAEYFTEKSFYRGTRLGSNAQFQNRFFELQHQSRYLESSDTARKNFFYRHSHSFALKFTRKIKGGIKDQFEQNLFSQSSLLASPGMAFSYRFHEWEPFAEWADSITGKIRLFYRDRTDMQLQPFPTDSARSVQAGGELQLQKWPQHPLLLSVQYREVINKNKNLFRLPDQKGYFNRLEYRPSWMKRSVTAGVFAETGYGLENRQEYYYLEVTPGQGQYAWVDYNADGLKQLNEFEPARFPDQARFIRVFVPTNDYIRVLKNQLDVDLNIRPSLALKPDKKWKKFVARWQWQGIYRGLIRFTDPESSPSALPIRIPHDSLIRAANNRIRITTFFNSGSPIFGAEHTHQKQQTAQLINFSSDKIYEEWHEAKIRYTIKRKITIFLEGRAGIKNNTSLLFPMRNYFIRSMESELRIAYQPGTDFRLSASLRYSEKKNRTSQPDLLYATDLSFELRYNLPKNGSIQSRAGFIQNRFRGNANSAAGFEMLNALQPGLNWVWEIGWQQNIAQNLQAQIYYQGRKNIRWIHTGNFEIRAFF